MGSFFSPRRRLPAAVLSVALGLLAPRAHAATLRLSSPDELCQYSTRVVLGRVTSMSPRPCAGVPASEITFEVLRSYKGPPTDRITFSALGGQSAGFGAEVDGEGTFQPGDEAVVFLDYNSVSDRLWLSGGVAGKLAVSHGALEGTRLPLEEFERRLQARLAGGGGLLSLATPAVATEGPHVLALTPHETGSAGDSPRTVRIHGESFGASPGSVTFPGWFKRVNARVRSWDDQEVVVELPIPDTALSVEVISGRVEVVDARGRSSREREDCGGGPCEVPSWLEVTYNHPRYQWPDADVPVGWFANPGQLPSCYRGALERAFEAWNQVPGSRFRFRSMGTTQALAGQRDGVNTVGGITPWPFSHTWIAATIPWVRHDPDSAVLLECDTGFNFDDFVFTCHDRPTTLGADLETVTLHESGHWLRLRHVNRDREIMQITSLFRRKIHSLGQGDRAGVSHIYPSYGLAEVVREGGWLCPAGDADSVVVRVTALDREGAPRVGLRTREVTLEARVPWNPVAPPEHYNAMAPTDSAGSTRVMLRRGSGRSFEQQFRVRVGDPYLASGVNPRLWTLDPSGDGRVGPEDFTLLLQGLPELALQGITPDLELARQHQGHHFPGREPSGAGPLTVVPNPARGPVEVFFEVPSGGPVEVEVLDVTGARVHQVWAGSLPAGRFRWTWDGTNDRGNPIPAGIYLLRARAGPGSWTRKVVRAR